MSATRPFFDLAMLEKLGMKTVETTTPWYTGKVRFDGIPLNKLMDLVGAKGTSARVLALERLHHHYPD